MSIIVGKDGTLTCNRVNTRWTTAANLIPDACFYVNRVKRNIWESYSNFATTYIGSDYCEYGGAENYAYASNNGYITINLKGALFQNHKYLVGFKARGVDMDSSTSSFSIDVYCGLRPVINSGSWNGTSIAVKDRSWKTYLSDFSYSFASSSDGQFTLSFENSRKQLYITKLFLVDLTDIYGSGNEPTASKLNGAIRELEDNFALSIRGQCIVSSSEFATSDKVYSYNYGELREGWEPRSYMYLFDPDSSNAKTMTLTGTQDANQTLTKKYMCCDALGPLSANSSMMFGIKSNTIQTAVGNVARFPSSTYSTGGVAGLLSGGWKRLSVLTDVSRLSGSSDSITAFKELSFARAAGDSALRITGILYVDASYIVDVYNKAFGTRITVNDINKEFCDRWISEQSLSFIHIKDVKNHYISFYQNYDIECNDIIPQPERNDVYFDYATGVIYCKKLVVQSI